MVKTVAGSRLYPAGMYELNEGFVDLAGIWVRQPPSESGCKGAKLPMSPKYTSPVRLKGAVRDRSLLYFPETYQHAVLALLLPRFLECTPQIP